MARNLLGYSLLLAGLPGVAERDLRGAHAMAESQDGLLAKLVTNVFLGLSLTALSKVDEALPYLRRGWTLSREFGGGLWRHRADYMLGEALLVTGDYEAAAPYFASCAEISKDAEPQVMGFSHATWALCKLRGGADPSTLTALLESAETGVPRIRKEKGQGMQLGVGIGVLVELYLRLGRLEEAYPLAVELLRLGAANEETYSYLRGSEVHTLAAVFFHAAWERRRAGGQGVERLPPVDTIRADARKSLANLRRSARIFPAVKPRGRMFFGIAARLDGNARLATAELTRAVEDAARNRFPWEEVVASVELARLSAGADRARWVARARTVAERHGLRHEVSAHPAIGIGFPDI
jgi:tetratricopeptide (TPR) repeat protein